MNFKFLIIAFIISIPFLVYKFRHPEQTETELFLNTIEAYKEFLGDIKCH